MAQIIQQRGMQDMTATIADFEQQFMERGFQEGFQKNFQKGMLEKAREISRLMLGDGEPERGGSPLYGSFNRRDPPDQA